MSADTAHRFLIAYDITDDPRRTRVANTLQAYGDRIQYSVFIIDAKPAKIVRVRAALRHILDLETDSVLICSLGPLIHGGLSRMEFVGRRREITGQGPLVL